MKPVLTIEIVEGTFGYTVTNPDFKLYRATVKSGKAIAGKKWRESPTDYEVSPAAEMSVLDALDAARSEVLRRMR